MIKLLKNANVYAPEKLGKKDILVEGEKILLLRDSIEGYEGLTGVETWREKPLFRRILTCMCILPEAAESRDRHPVSRNPSSASFSKTVLPP